MPKKVAILQSNYIPWKGYFDLINTVDEFILYDDMQYTKNDWRNRNQVKTSGGLYWLTIPVLTKGNFGAKINEIKIKKINWAEKHWRTINTSYLRAKYFNTYGKMFQNLYLNLQTEYLSEVNRLFIAQINKILDIKTKISLSSDYKLINGKTERLIDVCEQAGASEYYSGPAAKNYIKEELFSEAGIKLNWVNYDGYKIYDQLYPPFNHFVSIIDLIFNEGENSKKFMKSFNND